MNKTVVGIIFFGIGTFIGFQVAKSSMKQKYDKAFKEEFDSVKESFLKKHSSDIHKEEEPKESVSYENIRVSYDTRTDENDISEDRPFVISPSEFGENEDYDRVSLTYYSDGVLTDENDKEMPDDDIEEFVGHESLNHFGEYEDDSVFVENPKFKMYFEILIDERPYSSVLKEKPYLAE